MSVFERFEALNSPDNQMSREELKAQLEQLRSDALNESEDIDPVEDNLEPESGEMERNGRDESGEILDESEMSDRQKDIEELKEYREALLEYRDTEQAETAESSENADDSPE